MNNAVLGMLRRMVCVRTDVSEECIPSIIRVTRIGVLGTTLAVTSNRGTLRRNTIACFPASRVARNISDVGILNMSLSSRGNVRL
jgi:hypothetical protein